MSTLFRIDINAIVAMMYKRLIKSCGDVDANDDDDNVDVDDDDGSGGGITR